MHRCTAGESGVQWKLSLNIARSPDELVVLMFPSIPTETLRSLITVGIVCLICLGCGAEASRDEAQPTDHESDEQAAVDRILTSPATPADQSVDRAIAEPASDPPEIGQPPHSAPTPPDSPRPRRFADLMEQTADSAARFLPELPRLKPDDQRAAAEGIRKIEGKHLTLYTDLPSVDALPGIFDQAFPQWCSYFGLDPDEHADWHCTGVLMQDKSRFRRAGLLPDDLPPFPHGYSRNYDFWLYEQPSEYYRRHLLLHEGTHSFMNTLLGACGPPWYMEGIAELLATHDWSDGRLTLNVVPPSADSVPHWGRVKIVRDAFAEQRAMRLRRVVEYPLSAHRDTEPYAWCWTAAMLLDRHPAYRDLFRGLSKHVTSPDFNERFYRAVGDRWDELTAEWQVLVQGMDYGYDVERTAIDFTPGRPLPRIGATVKIRADRGWQNSGWRLDAGQIYQVQARGRYQIAQEPQPWPCEPGGVTLRYHDGRPLGMLLAAVHPDQSSDGVTPLLHPEPIGLGGTFTPEHSGTLMLKINDSPAELGDNLGTLSVRVTPR